MAKHSPLRSAMEFALVWPFLMAMQRLPLPAAKLLSRAAGGLLWLFTPRWRAVAHGNLAFAFPDVALARRTEIVEGVYGNLARVLLSIARMPRLTAANIGEWIEYEGFEHYRRALEKGRGALFMTAHLGNWELSAFAHARFGNPMHVVVRPLDNPYLDRLVDRYRRLSGNRTIQKQDAGRKILHALRRNEAVGILIDQNTAGEDRVSVDFFGRKAAATNAFAKIAQHSGAAIIPGFALWRAESQRYVLKFYPPLELRATGDREADLLYNTQLCQSMLERVIREYPDQWLWIHRRWKTQPGAQSEPSGTPIRAIPEKPPV